MMNNLGPNWIPRLSGLSMILTGLADILHGILTDYTTIRWEVDLIAITGGLGVLFAKQHNVTGGVVLQPTPAPTLLAKAIEQEQVLGPVMIDPPR